MMRIFLAAVSLIVIAAMSCSSGTPTLLVPTFPTPTVESPTLSELEELTEQANLAREYGNVLGNWAIALESAYSAPGNPLHCEDFALVFHSADEIRNWNGNFAHNGGDSDPDYNYVSDMLSALQMKYNEFAALDKTDVGMEIQAYAEDFEKPTNGIAADIQRGYIEIEYLFFILDPLLPRDYVLVTDQVAHYNQKLSTIEQFLTIMEEIRQRRSCGLGR